MDSSDKRSHKKAKRILAQERIKELMAMPQEVLAKAYYEMELGFEKQDREIALLKKEIESYEKETKNKKSINKKPDRYAGYDKSLSLINKIRFILKRNRSELVFKDIRDALLSLEPELKDRWGDIDHSVSQILSKASKLGAIIKTKAFGGQRGHFLYSFPKQT